MTRGTDDSCIAVMTGCVYVSASTLCKTTVLHDKTKPSNMLKTFICNAEQKKTNTKSQNTELK